MINWDNHHSSKSWYEFEKLKQLDAVVTSDMLNIFHEKIRTSFLLFYDLLSYTDVQPKNLTQSKIFMGFVNSSNISSKKFNKGAWKSMYILTVFLALEVSFVKII